MMQAKPASPSHRWMRLTLVLLGLLALGHTLLWGWMTQRLEAELAAWATLQRAAGWQVAHGPATRGGWPAAATLALPEVQLTDPSGLGWRSAAVELRLALPWPSQVEWAASGPQQLLAGPEALPFTAASLGGGVPLRPGPQPLRLLASSLRATTAAGPLLLRRGALTLSQPSTGGPGSGTGTGTGTLVDLALEGIALPALQAAAAAFGPEVQRLVVQATLAGPLPPRAPLASQAAAWRDAGGRVALHSLELLWGPVQAGGTAELALDPALQPSGRATLTLAGHGEALEALVAAGLLSAGNARGIGTLALLLQRPSPEGGPPRLHLPLLLRDRTLSAGGFTLVRLAPLRWPAQ